MHGTDFIQDLAVVMIVAGLVGWLCHRIGLSVVVGYLVAGMVIGPYTPPFALVSNIPRIETLAQVGLVFLMFSIGMKLSLRKLQRLGGSLVLATFVGAVIMYNVARSVGAGLGWGQIQTVFLAAMLMVSSSAVISKVLQELGATHEAAGQMAMGVSVLEDIVAVVMLTILNSLTRIAGPEDPSLGGTLGLLGAFVAVAGVGGLLAVPWLLRRMSFTADQELMTIVTAGLLFLLATLAHKAGFSLALGAFLLGAVVAETPYRPQVDRTFEGMRDLFSAVFFVAIGMMVDARAAAHLWWLVLLLTVVTLAGRSFALTTGLLISGTAVRPAVSVGLSVTSLGEFSFIIAQFGVLAGVLPAEFQAVAVGVSLLTALAAPVLTRNGPVLGERIEAGLPPWLAGWLADYHGWIVRLTEHRRRNVLWQLSRKRLTQVAVEMLLVSGLLAFSGPLLDLVEKLAPVRQLIPGAPHALFWSALALGLLVPLLAIWRNVSTLAMVWSEVGTAGHVQGGKLRPVVEAGIKLAAGLLLLIWLWAVVPVEGMGRWMPLVMVGLGAGALVFLRRKITYWHSMLEVELGGRFEADSRKLSGTATPWLASHGEWHLVLTECLLPDLADCRGRRLGDLGLRTDFGCVVAGIERQGVLIGNPPPDTALYPRDKVLLLGDPAQTRAGKDFLGRVTGAVKASNFDEVRMQTITLPEGSPLAGQTLAELAPSRRCGVQLAGIHRGGLRILNPRGTEKLLGGDDMLVMGSPDQIAAFRAWANGG